MRVLLLVSSMHTGGAERVAALLCNRWAGQGHEVTLMPTFSGRGDCLYPLDDRVQLDYLADRVGTTHKNPMTLISRLSVLRDVMRRGQFDAVVSFLTHVNVAALIAGFGLSVPIVVAERTFPPAMPLEWYWRILRRLIYPQAQAVVMQTQEGLDWLVGHCPHASGLVIANPVVFPLPNGVPKVSPEHWLPERGPIILAVGRLGAEKGFDILIRSFSRLVRKFPSWHLVILGEGTERARLAALITDYGIEGRVHLPGRVGNVGDWYARADLYVLTSHFEGFPNALIEAMAHSLPVVSFNCATGPREIVRDGVDGLLVQVAEGEAGIALAMERLLSDDSARQRMGEKAQSVRERFSIALIGEQWDQVIGLSNPASD